MGEYDPERGPDESGACVKAPGIVRPRLTLWFPAAFVRFQFAVSFLHHLPPGLLPTGLAFPFHTEMTGS